jgi:hypothetical protein
MHEMRRDGMKMEWGRNDCGAWPTFNDALRSRYHMTWRGGPREGTSISDSPYSLARTVTNHKLVVFDRWRRSQRRSIRFKGLCHSPSCACLLRQRRKKSSSRDRKGIETGGKKKCGASSFGMVSSIQTTRICLLSKSSSGRL